MSRYKININIVWYVWWYVPERISDFYSPIVRTVLVYSISHNYACSFLFLCLLGLFCQLLESIYLYSSELLHWHWGNHMIAPVPVKWSWRICVKLVTTYTWHNTTEHEPYAWFLGSNISKITKNIKSLLPYDKPLTYGQWQIQVSSQVALCSGNKMAAWDFLQLHCSLHNHLLW